MSALRNAIHREKCWTRNPINNADEGKIYERLVAVSTFLTLKDGEEMACEMKEAGTFDDIVLWVENDGYYLRQIKHKQQSNFEIRESNLFPSKPKDMFSLDLYISSFARQICKNQPFAQDISLIKELTLTTNVDFDPSLMQYLESAGPNNVWPVLDDTIRNERFIFKPSKFQEIRKKLKNPDKFDDHTINLFLEKIVFEVKYPSISALKAWIKRKLRLLIPLKLSDDQIEKATEILQKNFNDYFYNSMENSAGWADSQLRKPILLSILTHLKATLKIGSTLNYEGKSLLPILGEIKSIDFPLGILEKFEESIKKGYFDTLNIVVLPKECFPILTSSKILSYFRRKDKYNLDMVLWIVDVKSEDDGLELANIFGHWNIEIFTGFVFAVEFSQELCEKGTSSRIAQQIFDRLPNKHLLEFIFITTQAMNTIGNTGLVQELYDSLSYECFTENIRHRLIQKLLSIKNGPLLSLELLGIDLAFLDSLSLSELILADGKDQLDLLLPSYDDDLEKVYIPRKLRIPVLSKVDVNDGAKMERDSICSIRHLQRSLITLEIAPGQSAEFPWKSNVGDYGAVVDEDVLIVDGPLFDESNKVAIVVGMPGMGKSTLLTYLSKALLRNSQKSMQKLVIRTNLGNCHRGAWETHLKAATDLVQFFFSHSHNNKSKQPLIYLSKRIVEEIFLGRSCWSVIIMLDGFDEISYRGRSFISEKLIPLLMPLKGVYRIIVTSRPEGVVREKLESVFNGFALHLVELGSDDQEDILVSSWCKSISKENLFLLIDHSSVMEKCRTFAKQLVYLARHQLTDKGKTILDVPLQCALFAECFYVDLKNYIDRNCSLLGTDYNLDLPALFETLIENKFNIWFRDKEMLEVKNDRAQEMYETRQKSFVRSAMHGGGDRLK